MIKTKKSIITKIIVTVTVAFVLVFSSIYFVVFQNYKDALYKEQVNKINLLLNTLAPSVKINLEFGIIENIDKSFQAFVSANKEVKSIKLINLTNDIVAQAHRNNNYINIIVNTKILQDNITKKTIGFLKIAYSNSVYIKAVDEFQLLLIYIGLGIVIFLLIFSLILKYMLRPLSNITYKLNELDPENLKDFVLPKSSQNNEIAVINNTIVSMIEKIQFYTQSLENQVALEVKKNLEKEQFMLQQSRLAQLGEMISMIAHQWRQPLTSISSTVSALELKILLDQYDAKEFEKQLKNVSKYSQYLSSTINDFRNFFRSNNTQEATTSIKIIEDSLSIISPTLDAHNITITTHYTSKANFTTYKNEVQQVILNLLKNAQDILMEKRISMPIINISTYDEENFTYIEVMDNGGGIDSSIIDKIFDPYFTTKDKKDGTGLGLYMSKRIIEDRCKGILNVVNESEGAKFIIKIPLKKKDV